MASGILAQVGTVRSAALWTVRRCLRWLPIYVCRCSLRSDVAATPSPVAPQEPMASRSPGVSSDSGIWGRTWTCAGDGGGGAPACRLSQAAVWRRDDRSCRVCDCDSLDSERWTDGEWGGHLETVSKLSGVQKRLRVNRPCPLMQTPEKGARGPQGLLCKQVRPQPRSGGQGTVGMQDPIWGISPVRGQVTRNGTYSRWRQQRPLYQLP